VLESPYSRHFKHALQKVIGGGVLPKKAVQSFCRYTVVYALIRSYIKNVRFPVLHPPGRSACSTPDLAHIAVALLAIKAADDERTRAQVA
jgi:hypothetical protein